jgi:hypothetical protein
MTHSAAAHPTSHQIPCRHRCQLPPAAARCQPLAARCAHPFSPPGPSSDSPEPPAIALCTRQPPISRPVSRRVRQAQNENERTEEDARCLSVCLSVCLSPRSSMMSCLSRVMSPPEPPPGLLGCDSPSPIDDWSIGDGGMGGGPSLGVLGCERDSHTFLTSWAVISLAMSFLDLSCAHTTVVSATWAGGTSTQRAPLAGWRGASSRYMAARRPAGRRSACSWSPAP